MKIPDEFVGRVVKTKLNGLTSDFKKLDQIRKEWEGSEIDVVYENAHSIVVVVFQTSEDALAFKIKYGDEYV